MVHASVIRSMQSDLPPHTSWRMKGAQVSTLAQLAFASEAHASANIGPTPLVLPSPPVAPTPDEGEPVPPEPCGPLPPAPLGDFVSSSEPQATIIRTAEARARLRMC